MTERWALIRDGIVKNICLWDGNLNTWQPPSDYLIQIIPEELYVAIDYIWDGNTFVAPE